LPGPLEFKTGLRTLIATVTAGGGPIAAAAAPATEARDPTHKSGFQLDKIFFWSRLATVQHN
jgi:hypothetical protein